MNVKISRASDWNYEEYKEVDDDVALMRLIRETGSKVIVEFQPFEQDVDIRLTDYDDYVE